jgi:hypothetical protein
MHTSVTGLYPSISIFLCQYQSTDIPTDISCIHHRRHMTLTGSVSINVILVRPPNDCYRTNATMYSFCIVVPHRLCHKCNYGVVGKNKTHFCLHGNFQTFLSGFNQNWILLLLLLLLLLYDMDVSCHRPFLPGTSLEPAVIPTLQASSFTMLHTAVLSVLCVMFKV